MTTIALVLIAMDINHDKLAKMLFSDSAAIASMVVMGLSTGLMTREQFGPKETPAGDDIYAQTAEEWAARPQLICLRTN